MSNVWLGLAIAAITAATAYALSLWIHPWTRCRACNGGGRSRDWVWRYSYGSCRHCAGRGRKPRLGIWIITRARARQMKAKKGAHKIADHRGG